MKLIFVSVLSTILFSNSLFAIQCSESSDQDLVNYDNFLQTIGRFVLDPDGFRRDSEKTKNFVLDLYNHPHVIKFYQPPNPKYIDDLIIVLSALYREPNRKIFRGEAFGTKDFSKKVEKALLKVDTTFTVGLVDESSRVEQKPIERLTPEVIGKYMREQGMFDEIEGKQEEYFKYDDMIDQWKALNQKNNNSNLNLNGSSQSHGIYVFGGASAGYYLGKTQAGVAQGQQQSSNSTATTSTSASKANQSMGQAAGNTGGPSYKRSLHKKQFVGGSNSNSSTSNHPPNLMNDLGNYIQSIKNPPAYYSQNLERYYKTAANIHSGEILNALFNGNIELKSIENAVDLLLSFVNIYAAKGIRDAKEIDAFANQLDLRLHRVQTYHGVVARTGGNGVDFSKVINDLFDITGVNSSGFIGSKQRLVDYNDYEGVMIYRPDRIYMEFRGNLIQGELYNASNTYSALNSQNTVAAPNQSHAKANSRNSSSSQSLGKATSQQNRASANSSSSGFGEQEILNILQRSNTLGVKEKTWFDKNLEPYYRASTRVNKIDITDDLQNQRIEVRDVKEVVDLILTYVNIYSSRGIRDSTNIKEFSRLLLQELGIIVGSKPPGYRWPNFEFIVDSLYNISLGNSNTTGYTPRPVTIKDYVFIVAHLPKAETLREQNGQTIRGNLYK